MQNDHVLHQRVTKGLELPRVIAGFPNKKDNGMTDIHATLMIARRRNFAQI
jgi:hypothetical protein